MPMLIDQAGLPAGVPGFARRDGLDDGSLVTLTDTQSGGTTVFELLWVPLVDLEAIPSLQPLPGNSHVWSFSPQPGAVGPYRIKLTHTQNGIKTEEIRIFGIADENGRIAPAPGERTDPRVTRLNAIDPAIIARCERNWPLPGFPQGNPFGWALDSFISTAPSSSEPGAPGSTWRFGNDVPNDTLGIQGDFYLRTTNGLVYSKTADGVYEEIAQFAVDDGSDALLREANDFLALPHKPFPSPNDKLVLEDASASGAKAYSSVSELINSTPIAAGFPHLLIPSNPDGWDLETRKMTSPDLADHGWTVKLQSAPHTTLVRAGDVDMESLPSAGTYRSSLTGGVLLFQGPPNVMAAIYKATLPGPYTYRVRAWPSVLMSGYNHYAFAQQNELYGLAGSDTYYTGIENVNVVECMLRGPSNFTLLRSSAYTFGPGSIAEPILQIYDKATEFASAVMKSSGVAIDVTTKRGFPMSTTHAGLWLAVPAKLGSQLIAPYFHIDFIRRRPLLSVF